MKKIITTYYGNEVEVEVKDSFEVGDDLTEYDLIWSDFDNNYIEEDRTIYTEDQGYVAEDNYYYYCEDTGSCYISNNDLYYTEDTRNYYESNGDLYYCLSDDRRYKSDCDLLYLEYGPYGEGLYFEDDVCRCERCDTSYHCDDDHSHNSLDSYHSKGDIDFSKGSRYKIGIEIEKATIPDDDYIEDLKEKGWRCEEDGSLDDDGGEFITPILDINKALERVQDTAEELVNEYEVDSRCGGHIHISDSEMDTEELYSSICYYRPILWGLYPNRATSYYCNKDTTKGNKYRDVNPNNKTVEIRIFPGLKSINSLKFRIELIKFFLDNRVYNISEALATLDNKQKEFIEILDIVYKSLEKKMEALRRIYNFYEIGVDNTEKRIAKAEQICKELNK